MDEGDSEMRHVSGSKQENVKGGPNGSGAFGA
jgi:hypothetical protein